MNISILVIKLKMKHKLGHVLTAPFQVAVHLLVNLELPVNPSQSQRHKTMNRFFHKSLESVSHCDHFRGFTLFNSCIKSIFSLE